jgi:uncharacterized protein
MTNMDPVVHFEMPYVDSNRLIDFYQEAFGWQMFKLGQEMGNYITAATTETDENRMILTPGAINGGFFPRKDEGQFPSVVIGVADITKSMEKVKNSGGIVLNDPVEIPGVGLYVSFIDSEGNRLSMLQPLMK